MRVYLARGCSMPEELLEALFHDTSVRVEEAEEGESGKTALWRRLSLLEQCDAICLPADWRGDPEARIEKAYADYCRIPQLSYFLPGGKGGRAYRGGETEKSVPAQTGEDQAGAGAAAAAGDR